MRMLKRKVRVYYTKKRTKMFQLSKGGTKSLGFKKAKTKQTRRQPLKCFKYGEHGHISNFCKKQKPEKK